MRQWPRSVGWWRRPRGVVAVAVLAACALAAPAARAAPAFPQALHSVRGAEPGIFDALGREVLLRGANDNQLGDYYRGQPALDPVIALTEQDFAEMAALGFDSVRLIVHWSALEPEGGRFDESYVARVRQAVEWARAHRIYVVLDMHQDAWGKYVDTPPGEACPPGSQPSIGWDGAPRWATYTDGQSTCHAQTREVSAAVAQAFTNFYADRDGIQQELLSAWARLAREFAADPVVAGYDLLNEPHPGYTPGPAAGAVLGAYYSRAIAAIRAAESAVRGGFGHIVFFEPSVTWSGSASPDTVPPPAFTSDQNIVFAPHLYAESLSADQSATGRNLVTVEQGFENARTTAAAYGTTFWSGEWGWFGDPAADLPKIRRYARQEDAHLVGGSWWQWKQACGDPHNIGSPGASPTGVSPSLNRYRCPEQSPLGIPAGIGQVLSRAYPRAAPGRLTGLSSDPVSGDFAVRGVAGATAGDGCLLELWVPGDGSGPPLVAGTNMSGIEVRPYAGGWLVSGCAKGAYELHRVRGAEGSGSGSPGGGSADPRTGGGGGAPTPPARRLRPCRRVVVLRIAAPRRARVLSTTVVVDGRRRRHHRGLARRVRIVLYGPRRTHRVTIALRLAGHRRVLRRVRYFHTCARRLS